MNTLLATAVMMIGSLTNTDKVGQDVIINNSGYNPAAVIIETFAPHNRITDEEIDTVITVTQLAQYTPPTTTTPPVTTTPHTTTTPTPHVHNDVNRSTNAFLRKNVIVNGVRIQEIVVNGRVVSVVPVFNAYGFQHYNNVVNFNQYGANFLGYSDFDYAVTNQFYDANGNLIRQLVKNGVVVAQEVVPARFVRQFINAFTLRNFQTLRQLRTSGSCQFQTY